MAEERWCSTKSPMQNTVFMSIKSPTELRDGDIETTSLLRTMRKLSNSTL